MASTAAATATVAKNRLALAAVALLLAAGRSASVNADLPDTNSGENPVSRGNATTATKTTAANTATTNSNMIAADTATVDTTAAATTTTNTKAAAANATANATAVAANGAANTTAATTTAATTTAATNTTAATTTAATIATSGDGSNGTSAVVADGIGNDTVGNTVDFSTAIMATANASDTGAAATIRTSLTTGGADIDNSSSGGPGEAVTGFAVTSAPIAIAAATTTGDSSTSSGDKSVVTSEMQTNGLKADVVIGVAVGAAAILIIVTVVIIVIWRKKHAEKPKKRIFSPEQTPLTFTDSPSSDDPRRDVDGDAIYMNSNIKSRRIPLSELGTFVSEHAETIKQEYKDLPSGDLYPCTIAKKAENKGLNRFQNIHPYDRTRVVLSSDKAADDDDDDDSASYGHGGGYINASYMDGYSRKRRYIATQGPLSKTIVDFWSMIWSESCTSIVMLTSFVEEGKRKCEEYYPRDKHPVTYGAVTVELLSLSSVADYDLRSFKLVKAGQPRIVRHFHYLSWPDHGVPSCYAPFLLFRHRVSAFAAEASGPIAVHCSAGIGRTGAYVAVDYLLEEAHDKGSVDVFAAVSQLRNQRPNMVQNQDQYQFIYGAVLSGAMTDCFTLLPTDVAAHFFKLSTPASTVDGRTELRNEFEFVSSSCITPLPESEVTGSLAPENAHKNRDNSVPALDVHRPFLAPMTTGDSDYINAVFCNSFRRKNEFIATQVPMSHTADDFWRLVLDHGCQTIILIDEVEQQDQYWPAVGATLDTSRFTVTTLSEWTDPQALYTVRDLEVKVQKQPESCKRVRQCQLHFWPSESKVPSSAQAILAFTEAMSGWQSSSNDRCTVVQCLNGADHSGLFIAALNMLERLKEDHEVDVFHTVEMIKIFRPQFVTNEAQYIFLYALATAVLGNSEIY